MNVYVVKMTDSESVTQVVGVYDSCSQAIESARHLVAVHELKLELTLSKNESEGRMPVDEIVWFNKYSRVRLSISCHRLVEGSCYTVGQIVTI